MTNAKDIRGVIFDMDGVLCDSESLICDAAREMFLRRYDTRVRPEDFLPFVGMGENRYIGGPAEKYGIPIHMPEDKIYTYEIYLEIIKNRLDPLPGTVEFINASRTKGLKLAVASAADLMKVDGNLREIGFPPEMFDAVITGSDVTKHKPDPECFLKAAEKINLPPEQCLIVEDAISGVLAAKSAGAYCLGITTSFTDDQLRAKGADWTAPNLAGAPEGII